MGDSTSDSHDGSGSSILSVIHELTDVEGNTRDLVIVTHGFIELMVNVLIDQHCKNAKAINKDAKSFSLSAKLLLLNEMGLINSKTFKTLDWFRKLRDKAARKPIFKITKNELPWLPKRYHDPKRFQEFCARLITNLWQQHAETYQSVFAKDGSPAEPLPPPDVPAP